jgi:hypothetical protein
MSESDDAVLLANRVLDRPYIDPDGDICMLARQLLRRVEEIATLKRERDAAVTTLNYVADMTYCGIDAEWHFKPGYDPQIVLDALNPVENPNE